MGQRSERKVITELIGLYRDLPCLWDSTSESYKDSTAKKNAWDILAEKLKELDPTANAATAKRKIDNLRISHLRASKKVKASKKRSGSSTSDIHKPSLWYYDLLRFLEKKNEVKRKGDESLTSEDEDEPLIGRTKRKKSTRGRTIAKKKEKITDAANNLLTTTTESNAFGVYVGKKIEEIPRGQQRDLAEKLISDVIFLAKTNNLTFDTRIKIPSRTPHYSSHHSAQPFFVHSLPSTQVSHSPRSSSAASSNSYQCIKIERTPSPTSHTQYYSPSPDSSRSHRISHPATSPPLHSPIPSEPTPPSSHTQYNPPSPDSSRSLQISHPATSPPLHSPIPNEPTPPSSHT